MQSALLIRLRPRGPWRYGPADGAQDRVDALYRSDRLYSAVTLAMQRLGFLDEWLAATTRRTKPEIAFSSLFPFQGDTLFAVPPASIWPPSPHQVTAPNPVFLAKIRWKAVSFVPLTIIDTLLTGGSILADQWLPDPESACLLRRDRPNASPMRVVIRRTVPVDRVTRQAHAPASIAGVEFESGAGLWTVARFDDEATESAWRERLEGAFRLLADSGFGGRRTSGWGQSHEPEFVRGQWPALILPKLARLSSELRASSRYWLLSLYVPGAHDAVDWANGNYQLVTRAGRIENGAGNGAEKNSLRMIAEGSVLEAASEPAGATVDVAPEGFAHPIYRSGLALALELPEIPQVAAVEEPSTEEAVSDRPCEPAGQEPVSAPPAESELPGVEEPTPAPVELPVEHESTIVSDASPEAAAGEASELTPSEESQAESHSDVEQALAPAEADVEQAPPPAEEKGSNDAV